MFATIDAQPPTRNIQVHDNKIAMVIRKWWIHYSSIPLFLLTISWVAFTIFWYVKFVAGTKSSSNPILVVPLVIGGALIYVALAKAINKTEIIVTKLKLKVMIGPIPWPGSYEIDAFNINDVTVDHRTTVKSAQWASYEVNLIDSNGKEHRIINNLELSKQAYFIQGLIKSRLGLSC